jgi:hypothetical protein
MPLCLVKSNPVAARSKATAVVSRLLVLWVRIAPGHGCLSLVVVMCCQVEVSERGRSLIQSSPTECGVSSGCDREATQREAMT